MKGEVSDSKPVSRQLPAERLSFLHYCVLVGQSKLSVVKHWLWFVTCWCILGKADRTGEWACKIRSPQWQWLYRRRVRCDGCRRRVVTSVVSDSNGV